jgi:hypothetical protein
MSLLALAVAGAAAVASAQGANQKFVGKWEITETSPNPKSIYFLDVVDKGDHLEAKFLDRVAHATPVAWIRVENGELVWQQGNASDTLPKPSCGPIYRAKLEGGKLVGSHTTPGDPCPAQARAGAAGRGAAAGQRAANAAPAAPKAAPTPVTHQWVGVPAPKFAAANANGKHTYGTPVVIVGPGKGKEMWSGLTPDTWQNECADRWTFENGTMKNAVAPPRQPGTPAEKPTCNIFTKDKWQNFKAEADIVLDQGQNSGFYIRGRHELQLMLPNPNGRGGESTYPGQLMDIYGWKSADAPVANPAGQPQHLEVIVVGNRLTAIFNGKKVHDNAEIYAWTGGALDNKEDQPGPIMIQGDHSLVTITKLVVTPITKPGM